jgi:hypothetical protein
VLPSSNCGVADLVGAASLLISEDALDELTKRAKGEKEGRPEAEQSSQDAGPDAPRSTSPGDEEGDE